MAPRLPDLRKRLPALLRTLSMALLIRAGGTPALAAFTQYDTQTYDLSQGVPKFVDVNYIDLLKITQISLFRSTAGHDYSDFTQFGADAIKTPGLPTETCRSMKHYFVAPDATTKIYAPVSGVVSRMFDESIGGTQVQITSDDHNAFTFIVFHVVLSPALAEGDHVTAGQLLGHHTGTQTYSDIAVEVHTPTGYHLVSYFETLTDAAFAAYVARGVASRDQLIYTRTQADVSSPCAVGTNTADVTYPPAYFDLNAGTAGQTITAKAPPAAVHLGDAPYDLAATSSAGLPVSGFADNVSVCGVVGQSVQYFRTGLCRLMLTQAGDATHLAAPPLRFSFPILPAGAELHTPPRLGGVFPPATTGPQSYLRLYNSGTGAGTVTISLFDGASGATVAKWTSPAIAPGASPQYSVATLESAAAPGFIRPGIYGLRVEPETTIAGTFQHVLYNPAAGALTNASSCSAGIAGNPTGVIGVHTATLAAANPSSLIYVNGSAISNAPGLELYSADRGTRLGTGTYASRPYYGFTGAGGPIATHGAFITSATALESAFRVTPGPTDYHYVVKTSYVPFPTDFVQHLVSNVSAGVISDMTAQCDLSGSLSYTTRSSLVTGSVYSSGNPSAQSFLRVYNPASYDGSITVRLYDSAAGGPYLGQWTSPPIPPGAQVQFAMSAVESGAGVTKKPASYVVDIDGSFFGYFQHVLWQAPKGALSNLSTCSGSVTADPAILLAVHSSTLASAGYPSTAIVNNTGAAATAVTLGIYAAATGKKLGSFTSAVIPINGQLLFTSAALESAARITPDPAVSQYVVKAEGPFTGFLQHYVNNVATGAITDMTLVCAM